MALALLGATLLLPGLAAGAPTQQPDGIGKAPPLRGFNQNWSYFPPLDGTMMRHIAELRPSLLRYPGGTVTHTWNWRKGISNKGPGKYPHPLSDLMTLHRATGAGFIIVLDILNPDVEDQLAMLRGIAATGLPIERIELGNELYAQDQRYEKAFPTGAAYAARVGEWLPRLRKDWPQARIAALLLGRQVKPENARMFNWNRQVVDTLAGRIDAFTYHIYIGERKTAAQTMAEFLDVSAKARTGQTDIWITEYGNQHGEDEPGYLEDLDQLADFVENLPGVSVVLNHQIVGAHKNKLSSDGQEWTPEGRLFLKRATRR